MQPVLITDALKVGWMQPWFLAVKRRHGVPKLRKSEEAREGPLTHVITNDVLALSCVSR